jgi:hypothetical protein
MLYTSLARRCALAAFLGAAAASLAGATASAQSGFRSSLGAESQRGQAGQFRAQDRSGNSPGLRPVESQAGQRGYPRTLPAQPRKPCVRAYGQGLDKSCEH